MTRKHVYRIGDQVRILRPRWVRRVGYPLIWTDLLTEVSNDPRTLEAMKVLDIPWPAEELVKGIARQRVVQRGFGGKERAIIYRPLASPDDDEFIISADDIVPAHGHVGSIATVYGKRVVKTGVRFPACGHGEDWEPGGLSDEKTHVLLFTGFGEIETCDVEPAQ